QVADLTPLVEQKDKVAEGFLKSLEYNRKGRLARVEIVSDEFPFVKNFVAGIKKEQGEDHIVLDEPFGEDLFEIVFSGLEIGDEVIVSSYKLKGESSPLHYRIRRADQPLKDVYDQEGLPSYLFIGAAMMVLGILCLLCRQLPDF